MASTAYAYEWDEAEVLTFRPAPRHAAPYRAWEIASDPDVSASRAVATSEHLPLSVRVGVVAFGAVIGWATPIALACSLLR